MAAADDKLAAALKAAITNAAEQQAKATDPGAAEKWQGIINQNRAALAELGA